MRFWPAIQNFKGGRQTKLISKDIHSILKHYFFRDLDNIPNVPNNVNFTTLSSDKEIRIKIYTKDYKEYEDFNWVNVNYFMSDFNEIGDVDQTYWFVTDVRQTYGGMGSTVEYTLQLDTFHTFYDYFVNSGGNFDIQEMHNDRWQQDKDGKWVPDLQNVPYIENCNDYCKRYSIKHEYNEPYQLFDSKHFNYNLTPKDNNAFITISGNAVTKQVRGFIILWCRKVSDSNAFPLTLIDKVVIPFYVFIFPVYDDFDKNKFQNGIYGMQNDYNFYGANMVGDLLNYNELEATNWDGWYKSSTDDYTTATSNMLAPIDAFGNINYTQDEIMQEIIEPHLDALGHTEYNISSVAKQSIVFNKNKLLWNLANVVPPNSSTEIDTPILDSSYYTKVVQFKAAQSRGIIYWSGGKEWHFYMQLGNGKAMFRNLGADIDAWNGDIIDIIKGMEEIDELTWTTGSALLIATNGGSVTPGHESEFLAKVRKNKLNPVGDADIGSGVSEKYYALIKGSTTVTSDTTTVSNVINFEDKRGMVGVFNTYYYLAVLENIIDKKWFLNYNKYISSYYIQNYYTAAQLVNPGPYNSSVIGYKITGIQNDRFVATEWYVIYNKEVYLLPIGQLQPRQYKNEWSDYFWYDDNVVVLTKQIGFFSPEEMGLRNILLDTDTSTAEKIDNSKMVLMEKGAYDYPYASDAYVDYMKTNKNQFNAGYANIESNLRAAQVSTLATFGNMMGNGMANTMFGGPLNFARGLSEMFGGALTAASGMYSAKVQAENQKRSLMAQQNDAKNLRDNVSVKGSSSTLTDTILKEFVNTINMYSGYWNFWGPVLHKLELSKADQDSVIRHFNKYGYEQDRIIKANKLTDLMTRWAFNRVKLNNAEELFTKNGISEFICHDVVKDFTDGVWLWDADKVDYDGLLDFTVNNYEVKFYIPPEEKKMALERELEAN